MSADRDAGKDIRAGSLTTYTPKALAECPPKKPGDPLRVAQWNIERGYQLPRIVQRLRQLDADVLCLQELDIGCERSGYVDVMRVICNELGMPGVFFCEFEELLLTPDVRKRENAAGPHARHGNAIFSRLPFDGVGSQPHSQNLDWSNDGVGEPRVGRRGVQWARLRLPNGKKLHVYNAHFEVFCGVKMRVAQFSDMVQLASQHRREQGTAAPFHAILCGDLNTMAHGVVRLSKTYARDVFRFLLWGETEGEWFARHFIDRERSPFRPDVDRNSAPLKTLQRALFSTFVGLSRRDAFGFCVMQREWPLADPFDVYNDVTLNHPKYRGLVQGKLDWLLMTVNTLVPTSRRVFNKDFSASDHCGLCVDITTDTESSAQLELPENGVRQPAWRNWYRACVRSLLFLFCFDQLFRLARLVFGF